LQYFKKICQGKNLWGVNKGLVFIYKINITQNTDSPNFFRVVFIFFEEII